MRTWRFPRWHAQGFWQSVKWTFLVFAKVTARQLGTGILARAGDFEVGSPAASTYTHIGPQAGIGKMVTWGNSRVSIVGRLGSQS